MYRLNTRAGVLPRSASSHFDTMPCNTMQCNTMQCNRRQYNTCNTKKYHVIPYLSRLKPQLGRWGLFSQAGWFHMGCNSAG